MCNRHAAVTTVGIQNSLYSIKLTTLLFAFNTKDRTAQGEFRAPGQGARQIFATAATESGAPPRCGTALRLTLPPLSGGVWAIG